MKNIIKIVVFILLLVNTVQAEGIRQKYKENQNIKHKYKEAESYLDDENYEEALIIFQELLSRDTLNANINYKIGLCYLNISAQEKKSIKYLELASKNISLKNSSDKFKEKTVPIDVLFYLGKAYHLNYELDKAEMAFVEFKNKLNKNDKRLKSKVDYELRTCETTRLLMKTPINIKIENLGSSINTKYDEHSPIISADNKSLIFTSKREGNTGGRQSFDGQYFEDIYISYFDGKKFSKAEKISSNINTDGHDACSALSHDGKQLLIFRSKGDGGLFISENNNNTWSKPKKLPGHINSIYRETSACFSKDGETIYFTSDRDGGYGGLDIYKTTRLRNGRWSKVKNMGPKINTKYDEESPYESQTGNHFFFASKGHNTMGGYDIFICAKNQNGEWGSPKNVGYPVNTPYNQIFETSTADSKIFYIASNTYKGYGRSDIFRIILPDNHIKNVVEQKVIVNNIQQKENNRQKVEQPVKVQYTKKTVDTLKKTNIEVDTIIEITQKNIIIDNQSTNNIVLSDNNINSIHSLCLLILLIIGSLFIIIYWIAIYNKEKNR